MWPLATASCADTQQPPCPQAQHMNSPPFPSSLAVDGSHTASLAHAGPVYPHSDCKDERGIYAAFKVENSYNISDYLDVEKVSN